MSTPSRSLWPELKGACLLGFALMLLLAFATYDPQDPTPWFSTGAMGEHGNIYPAAKSAQPHHQNSLTGKKFSVHNFA